METTCRDRLAKILAPLSQWLVAGAFRQLLSQRSDRSNPLQRSQGESDLELTIAGPANLEMLLVAL